MKMDLKDTNCNYNDFKTILINEYSDSDDLITILYERNPAPLAVTYGTRISHTKKNTSSLSDIDK